MTHENPRSSDSHLSTMGNRPSLFTKSPQEYAKEFYNSVYVDEEHFPAFAPEGFARVHFYFQLDRVKKNYPPDIAADVPLCKSGALDLRRVKDMWGLVDCKAIDPYRYQLFQPQNPEVLSPLAVRNLAFERVIYVTETGEEASYLARRLRLMPSEFCEDFVENLGEFATPLGTPLRAIKIGRQHIRRHQRNIQNVFLLFLLLFMGLVASGVLDLQITQRFHHWARTGLLTLP